MKRFFLTSILTSLLLTAVFAQRSIVSFQHSTGIPLGQTHDFIGEPSFRGFSMSFKRFLTPELTLGIDAGLNSFYERRDYDTYTEGTVSISGIQYRYINTFPLHLTANYIFFPDARLRPHVGFGAGTVHASRQVDMGLFGSRNSEWMFSIKPEAGLLFSIDRRFGISLSGRYHHAFDAGNLNGVRFGTINLGLLIID